MMVGFKLCTPGDKITAGGHLMAATGPVDAAHDQGYISSAAYSPVLGHMIGLAFLKGGASRLGERMRLVSPVTELTVEVEIVSPQFIDPEGERLRA